MNYLYVLKSANYGRYYIGITSDIPKRLKKHSSGDVRSTRAYRPWIFVHQEEFSNKTDARKREIYLKKNYQARKEMIDKIK